MNTLFCSVLFKRHSHLHVTECRPSLKTRKSKYGSTMISKNFISILITTQILLIEINQWAFVECAAKQFANMIRLATNREALLYNQYGNHCGLEVSWTKIILNKLSVQLNVEHIHWWFLIITIYYLETKCTNSWWRWFVLLWAWQMCRCPYR